MKRKYFLILLATICLSDLSKAQTTESFTYSGSVQSFTVPPCVFEITINANGATGANGATSVIIGGGSGSGSNSIAGSGAVGGVVSGTMSVTPGQVLYIYVGGAAVGAVGGYNGGGNGGIDGAGAGGGASDVRLGGTNLNDRIMVAGGGGGGGIGGCYTTTIFGGNGGVGGTGNGVNGVNSAAGAGGLGGVGTTGGAGGAGCSCCLGSAGVSGISGLGGNGGDGGIALCTNLKNSGGGGGGGYFGGGGGGGGSAGTTGCSLNDTGAGGGGAGGSNYLLASFTSTTSVGGTAPSGNGSVTITYSVSSIPTVTTTSDDSRCEQGSVTLGATSSAGTIDWYAGSAGGSPLLSSSTSYSPVISATTTYYAEANNNGCLSALRSPVQATMFNSSTSTTTVSACNSYTWIDGNTYSASNNTATWTLPNSNGCDSIVSLDLSINYSSTGTDAHIACDSFTWIDGNTYTGSNNTATWSIPNSVGCDSTIALNLTINNSTVSSITENVLDSYTAPSGATYTSSGIYFDTIPNNVGCDSILTINLTLGFTGLDENQLENVMVYPNPSNDIITVAINDKLLGSMLKITDRAGRVVYEGTTNEVNTKINIAKLESGLYYLKVSDLKLLKFVKL